MKYISVLIFLTVICISTYTNLSFAQDVQSHQIKGVLVAQADQKTEDVMVHLVWANDKKLVKMEFPDAAGKFVFEGIKKGKYLLLTQSMNYLKYQSDTIMLSGDLDLGNILLQKSDNSLKEVVVTGAKPLVQQQYDKTVINVANSITSVGSTALEVLQKAPGINVDQNDNISMRGRQGVLVMIDESLCQCQDRI